MVAESRPYRLYSPRPYFDSLFYSIGLPTELFYPSPPKPTDQRTTTYSSNTNIMPQQRRRRQAARDDEEEDMQHQLADADYDGDERMEDVGTRDETSQLIKNLVRYALACEYSRTPIRRDGIKEKGSRSDIGSCRKHC